MQREYRCNHRQSGAFATLKESAIIHLETARNPFVVLVNWTGCARLAEPLSIIHNEGKNDATAFDEGTVLSS